MLDTYDAHHQVRLDIVKAEVGPLNDQELELADELGLNIFCFNVYVAPKLKMRANDNEVPLEQFNVIYKLVERLKVDELWRIPKEKITFLRKCSQSEFRE